jgi:hypothetical protein
VGVQLIWELDPVVDPSREELATINEDGCAVDVTPGVAREEESGTDDLGEVTEASWRVSAVGSDWARIFSSATRPHDQASWGTEWRSKLMEGDGGRRTGVGELE